MTRADNRCIYPEYIPMHELAPSPHAAQFPLEGLHLYPVSICHTLVYLALSHYTHRLLPSTDPSALANARSRVYHHRGQAIGSLTSEIAKITDRASDTTIISVLMVLFSDVGLPRYGSSPDLTSLMATPGGHVKQMANGNRPDSSRQSTGDITLQAPCS